MSFTNLITNFNFKSNDWVMGVKFFKFTGIGAGVSSLITLTLILTVFKNNVGIVYSLEDKDIGNLISVVLSTLVYSLPFFLIIFTGIAYLFSKSKEKETEVEQLEGNKILTENQLLDIQKLRDKASEKYFMLTDKIKFYVKDLYRMVGVFGTTGAGKSIFTRRYIINIMKYMSHFKIIIYDPKREFFMEFYNKFTDIIIALDDIRSQHLNLLTIVKGRKRVRERVISSVILPATNADNESWVFQAKAILTAIFVYCEIENITKMSELKAVCALPFPKLAKLLNPYVDIAPEIAISMGFIQLDPKQADINASIFKSRIAFIFTYPEEDYLPSTNGDSDFEEFLANGQNGFIWILGDEEVDATILKERVRVTIELSATAIYSLGNNPKSSTFYIVDEFSELGKMDALQRVFTKGRSYKTSAMINMQSASQGKKIYGKEDFDTILGLLNTKLIFKSGGKDNLEELQAMIGKKKIKDINMSQSNGVETLRAGMSSSENKTWEEVVTTKNLADLESGEFYYNDPKNNWAKLRIPYNPDTDEPQKIIEPYMYCTDISYADILKKQQKPVLETWEEVQNLEVGDSSVESNWG